MSEQTYDVNLDLGDDPQESAIAERECSRDPDFNILEYDFKDDDSRGERGIIEDVRGERRTVVVPRQRWGRERSAEEEALSVVPDTHTDTGADPDADDETGLYTG